jgi:hypothetical protein
MTKPCRCCNGTGIESFDRVADLREWCRERGHWVSPLDEVRTETAAEILGVSAQWLRTQACYYDLIPSRRSGRHRLWLLADLVERIDV